MHDCLPTPPVGLELMRRPEGLTLVGEGMELRADFSELLPRLREGALARELLVRAARIKGMPRDGSLTVLDATAGLGEDSLLLAAAGFTVELYELDEVIAALLCDALGRARAVPELAPIVARMRVTQGDSLVALRERAEAGNAPDVVYLDPMFPERRKRAAVKKKFQLLHNLEHPCGNEAELIEAALGAGPRKIVVKRPIKGPVLAGVKPSYAILGKAVRYDVIVPPRS